MADPMGPIQVIPPGLMGTLQLKTGGQMPQFLGDTYMPCLDIAGWLLQANRRLVSSTYTINVPALQDTVAFTTAITVPAKQAWYVHAMALTVAVSAGDALNGQIGIVAVQQSIGTMPLMSPQLIAPVVAASNAPRWGSEPKRIFLPGTSFLFAYTGFANASNTSVAIGALEITECPL